MKHRSFKGCKLHLRGSCQDATGKHFEKNIKFVKYWEAKYAEIFEIDGKLCCIV